MMMSASNPTTHAPLLSLLILLTISLFKLSFSIGNTPLFCPEIEKQSLLSFKKSLEDPSGFLSSWDGEVICCKWKGVICNDLTGHVSEIRLRRPFEYIGLTGNISSSSSLLNLKHLRYLDLSSHLLLGLIPSFIGSLANLEYLNLSDTLFRGKIPHTIGNLSNLHTLDLRRSSLLDVDSLEWASGLSHLEYLNLDGVNLSQATNWPQLITSLPSLIELHFEDCSLDFMAPLQGIVNITTLQHLYLSSNFHYLSIPSFIPKWIFQLSNLIFLDLKLNFFTGAIPSISNATKLHYIDLSLNNYLNSSIPDWLYFCKDLEFVDLNGNRLSGRISNSIANLTSLKSLDVSLNQLSGNIPKEIANLCKIQSLDLTFNEFEGEISETFGNMSECFLENLESLDLRCNKLSGHLTDQFGEFKILRYLSVSNNSLSGVIPLSLWNLSSLEKLHLSDNHFSGALPESVGQLFNLVELDINHNMLEGVVTESHFANLTKLVLLSASGNHFTLKVSHDWNPPFQLESLEMASWSLGYQIPSWLETQKNMEALDLSNTGISGEIPTWAWHIKVLILSNNHLHGNLYLPAGLKLQNWFLFLDSNKFSGLLPQIDDQMEGLNLSNNSFSGGLYHFLCDNSYKTYRMTVLHLGKNQLSGELPDCWMKWPQLAYLNLGYNNLTGSIPNSIGYLATLQSLNLPNNKLTGEIPYLMRNCTTLVKIDLSSNELDGGITAWVWRGLSRLTFLILGSNKLSGNISSEVCYLNSLQIVDLSDNKFSGIILRCLSNLTAMSTKRYLYPYKYWFFISAESALVTTKGMELLYETTLSLVTSIDLSRNNLCGHIPKELTSLVELRSLNLSRNRFTGSIPDNIGDMRQMESLDFSNNSLSGNIPPSLTLLSFLSCLNLSYNNLTGEIPQSAQLSGMDASSFIGNGLCGPPLTINCHGDIGGEVHGHKEDVAEEEEGGDESKIEWLYVLLSLGYAVGVSAVCSSLVLNRSWRDAYFGFLQSTWDKIYVYVCVKWNKLSGHQNS